MTLRVKLVIPVGEIWAGTAERVVAKTLDGDIGILTGHAPVLGILSEGSVVRILPADTAGGWIDVAVSSGFLSVADDRVSVLVHDAMLGPDVNAAAVRAELEALSGAPSDDGGQAGWPGYLRAQLRAAGEES